MANNLQKQRVKQIKHVLQMLEQRRDSFKCNLGIDLEVQVD